jgi:hypothetical protein
MKKYLFLLPFTFLLLATSCTNEREEALLKSSKNKCSSQPEFIIAPDTLAVKKLLQTDAECVMLNHITFIDGECVLLLNEEEALEIGIPVEIYEKYDSYVKTTNSAEK